jgi:phosphate transport system substrate-binding protein
MGKPIRYDGATTIGANLLPDIAPLLERKGQRLGKIGDRGSNPGLEAARAGEVDVGGVCREMTAAEKGSGIHWVVIGYDALAVFVNESSPVRTLTRAQLKGIFTGAIQSWKEAGGGAQPIVAVTETKAGGRGAVQELRRIALDGAEYGPTREYDDAPSCVRHVAGDPAAITVASLSMALPGTRAIAIDGIEPSARNVRAGSYLLGRPMYLVSRAPPSKEVLDLFEVLLSAEGQAVVSRKFTPAR